MDIQNCINCSKQFSYKEVVMFGLRKTVLECNYCKTKHKEADWFKIIFYVATFLAVFLLQFIIGSLLFVALLWLCCWHLTYPFFAQFEMIDKS